MITALELHMLSRSPQPRTFDGVVDQQVTRTRVIKYLAKFGNGDDAHALKPILDEAPELFEFWA